MFGSAPPAFLVACVAALAVAPCVANADATADRSGDLAAFVHGGLAAAPNNFSSVRGSRIDTSKFSALVNFGPTFSICTVDDDTAVAMENGGISAWSLDCDSQPIDAPPADLLAQLKSEISASIPASFVPTTFQDADGVPHVHWKGPSGLAIDAYAWRTASDGPSLFRVAAIHLIGMPPPPSEALPPQRS
jgi:hypothetical protein